MTAITAQRAERNASPLEANNVVHRYRRLTDKYCIPLFFICYIVWVLTAQLVVHRKPDCEIDPRIAENCPPKFDDDDENTDNSTTFPYKTLGYVSQIWGKNWLFDSLTLNIGFLDHNYQTSGSIVICAHIFFSLCLIAYYLSSTRTDRFYCYQIINSTFIFGCIFIPRLQYFDSKNFNPPSQQAFFIYFPVPEVLMFIIMYAKFIRRPGKSNKNKTYNAVENVNQFIIFPVFFINVIGLFLLIFVAVMCKKYYFDWDSQLIYIFAGTICYMCLINYYFWLMVMSCATSISIDRERDFIEIIDSCLRAIFIIARYHFGTACYHATLLLPRINATFIMNEREFKNNSKLSMRDRICLTQWTIPNLSSMVTAARGHNHTESIRELLRMFANGSPKLKNFQIHGQIFRSFLAFLIGVNSLLMILMWAHGVILDPVFSVGTWIAYLIGIFFALIVARFFDAVSDTVWFDYHEKAVDV